MKTPIYLDNSATTPLDPHVVEAMLPWLTEQFGNPASSSHVYGHAAARAVEAARDEVAKLVNADPRDIVWTSGATESNNLAIKGAALAAQKRGRHLVTVQTEHKAVLDTMQWLEKEGFTVTSLAPQKNGLLDIETFRAALRPDTTLASVMLVNNEIGVIQDIAALGAICRERGVLFHVDAAQATGKVAINLAQLPVDLMSLTAHKTYGPKGIGALYVRRSPQVRVESQMHGGGHERGLRSGTLATHQIVGMGTAFRIAGELMATEVPQLRALRDRFWNQIKDLPGVLLNGDFEQRIANNLNISLDIPNCDSLVTTLSDIAVSSTSACSTGGVSHVLQALGTDAAMAGNSIRITVGRFNTVEEIDWAADYLRRKIEDCRAGRLRAA
ncbi:MAG: IscS subfamily cysteine desulfurase [Burkholderiales bacterium]|nr:IscS subfamily cysteine desulfurase [Burkholderiales bacterium]